METKSRSKQKLYFILAIFIFPMLASILMYCFADYFNFKTTNHGNLVEPAFHSEDLTLLSEKPKTWQIVYLPNQCSDEKVLYTLHQLRKALGKNTRRVSLTLVTADHCKQVPTEFRTLAFSAKQLGHFQKAFGPTDVKNKIYLVDPIGNLFMYYDSSTNPMNILKDLQKVLEVSQIG